jgi:hypothetical protein
VFAIQNNFQIHFLRLQKFDFISHLFIITSAQIPALFSPFSKYPKGTPNLLNDIGEYYKDFTKQQISYDFNELVRMLRMKWNV